jgi:hypothetical protein
VAVAYDFPSASLNAVYGRLKIREHDRLVRLVRSPRSDHIPGDRIRMPILAKGVGPWAVWGCACWI